MFTFFFHGPIMAVGVLNHIGDVAGVPALGHVLAFVHQALGLVSVPGDSGDHIFNMFVSNRRNMFNLFHQNWDDPGAVCGSGSTEGGTAERKELVEAGGKPLEDEFFSMRQMAMEHFFLEHPLKQLFRCSPGMGLDP